MNKEIMRVLKMVEEGKIGADKAKEIIEALNDEKNSNVIVTKKYEEKFLRIKILSAQGDKVNVQLPVKVIKEILKVTGKLPISTNGMDGIDIEQLVNTIVSCLDNEVMGEIVDICSVQGDTVKVVIE